ncbi:hypothetical protein SprV_0100457900 [Sparganum proliferum]
MQLLETLLELNTASLDKLDKCEALEAELQTRQSHLLDEIRNQCAARDWPVPGLAETSAVATAADKESEGVVLLHQEWRQISEEAESALRATADQLAECETAAAAFARALTWLRTQSTRMRTRPRLPTPVVSRFTTLQLSLRSRLTEAVRDYAAEVEFLESLIASQSDLGDWWKEFNEEIVNGRAEVEAAFQSVRKVLLQLDSATKGAEAELSTLISATADSQTAHRVSLECMRDFASELNAWNDWLASTTRTSPTLLALLGTSSAPEVVLETGDGLIRSLSAAATRLSEATRPANDLVAPVAGPQTPEDYLPSTLATSMACDLVRHLGGTWEHLRGDLSQLRAHKASSVAAMHALHSRLDELTSWVTENRRTLLDDLKPHFACRSIDSSFEDLVGQIGPSWRNAVSAVDMFTDYSARATEYCSQVTSFLQKLELRKGDFDSLREEAARVGRSENPDPSCPPVQPGDADALLTDYATLVQDARGLIDAGQRRMTCQRELTQQWATLRAQCEDLKALLTDYSTLSGDRHVLGARLDRLNQQIAGARERFDCSRRLSAQLVENCAQRIAAHERLRATIAENATWLEDAEKQLETLRAVERFTGETFSSPLADMHSSSEPIFRDAEEIATLRQRFKAYEASVSSWLQEEELAINAINELDTAFVTVLEYFTSYVEEFFTPGIGRTEI